MNLQLLFVCIIINGFTRLSSTKTLDFPLVAFYHLSDLPPMALGYQTGAMTENSVHWIARFQFFVF